MPTIAQALGVRDVGSRPALHAVTDFLREKRLLLLLDNFEQILLAASDIAELLRACPHLTVLVTSRAVLHLRGEHEFRCRRSACPSPAAARSPPSLPRILPSRCSPSERWRRAQASRSTTTTPPLLPRSVDASTVSRWRSVRPPHASSCSRPRRCSTAWSAGCRSLTGGARDLPERQRTPPRHDRLELRPPER